MRRFICWGAILALVGCASSGVYEPGPTVPGVVDADGDGISDEDEIAQGLDPNSADSDGDGLMDNEELDLGSDPLDEDTDDDWLLDGEEVDEGTDLFDPDSDGDRYLDGDEVLMNTDPLDPQSRIYQGGWPFNREADDVNSGAWSGALRIDDKFGPLDSVDQFGEDVDLFHFSGKHQSYKFIIVDASAEWCGPCQATSMWLGGGPDYYDLEPTFANLRAAVDNWELAWVTVLTQNDAGGPATPQDCAQWDAAYPHENVAVLHDVGGGVESGVVGALGGWPSGALLRARNMKVEALAFMVPDLLYAAQNEL